MVAVAMGPQTRVIVRAFYASQLATVEAAVNKYIDTWLVKREVLVRKVDGEFLLDVSITRGPDRWIGVVQATVLRHDRAGDEVAP